MSRSHQGLPYLGYLGVETPGKWVYLGGGLVTALVHMLTVIYIAASQHRRITTYQFEFPHLCDEALNITELSLCHCFCGRVRGGWPATRLGTANIIQATNGPQPSNRWHKLADIVPYQVRVRVRV